MNSSPGNPHFFQDRKRKVFKIFPHLPYLLDKWLFDTDYYSISRFWDQQLQFYYSWHLSSHYVCCATTSSLPCLVWCTGRLGEKCCFFWWVTTYFLISSTQSLLAAIFVFCWPFGPRSGPTECLSWSGSKPFDTLEVFGSRNNFKNLEKNQQRTTKVWKITQHAEFNIKSWIY